MTKWRKRGRPKTDATLERERLQAEIDKVLDDAKSKTNQYQAKEAKAFAQSLEQAERRLLRSFNSPPVPKRLVFAELSIDPDPMLEGPAPDTAEFRAYKEAVIRESDEVRSDIASGQRRGSETAAKNRNARIEAFSKANRLLIQRLGKKGYSTRQVTARVLQDWDRLDSQRRLPGEPESLTRRGDGCEPPKAATLRQSWLPKAKKRLGY
jgi:hypothetical protein